jgi:uncharacterized protein YbjT (DUF2867 family)
MSSKVLITGATGDTGRAAAKESIKRGLDVRAMVYSKDDRSAALEELDAEVVVGDLHKIDTIRQAMEGVDAAYLVYAYSLSPLAGWPRSRKVLGYFPSPQTLNDPVSFYKGPSGVSGSSSRHNFNW